MTPRQIAKERASRSDDPEAFLAAFDLGRYDSLRQLDTEGHYLALRAQHAEAPRLAGYLEGVASGRQPLAGRQLTSALAAAARRVKEVATDDAAA